MGLYRAVISSLYIFVNDIYGGPGQLRFDMGVSIPGVPMLGEGRSSGLLFADDLVGMSETILGVEKQAERISQWCDTWEMGGWYPEMWSHVYVVETGQGCL